MPLKGKKLSLLLSAAPHDPAFAHGLGLARAALAAGMDVYLYCIDEAVAGVEEPSLQALSAGGAKLFACAESAQRRRLPTAGHAAYGGLTVLGELIAETERFVAFT